jgi:hypothetical protein
VMGSTGEAPVIADGEGGGAATVAARVPVNARRDGSMCVSRKRLRGLGKVLGGSAGSGEARASELHGGGAMADDGKGERSCGCSGGSFYTRCGLEEGPRLHGVDKLARAVMGQRRPVTP